jgi:hypothetical protein
VTAAGQVEAVIRRAFGEPVDVSAVHPRVVNTIRLMVISEVAGPLGWTTDQARQFEYQRSIPIVRRG